MWIYEGQEFTDPGNWFGFVYIIENKLTGQQYVGMKYFTKAARKQTNGKVKKIRVESDWQNYWSSSKLLQADVEKYGKENFERTILRLCKTKGETSYWELVYQIDYRVLTAKMIDGSFAFYNDNITMKHTRKNIGKID